jgi:hypothetical protein
MPIWRQDGRCGGPELPAAGCAWPLRPANIDNSYRALAGLRGSNSGWTLKPPFRGRHPLDAVPDHQHQHQGLREGVRPVHHRSGTGRTISDNPAYKFGEISDANAALLRDAYPTFDIQSWTKLITWDGKVEGTIAKIGGREVRAVGASLMRESFYTPGNQDAANGLITQQGGSWFDGQRNIAAVFARWWCRSPTRWN